MKWLQFFRKRKKHGRDGDEEDIDSGSAEEDGAEDEQTQIHKRRHPNTGGPQSKTEGRPISRPSLDQWFAARRARTSIDIDTTTTTDKLTVCKAGITTLINRTYIVIKHLGSGTYGQVKLAFNIKDRKLYAIKSCRKSQYGMLPGAGTGLASPRLISMSRSRRSLTGAAAGMHGAVGAASRAASASQVSQAANSSGSQQHAPLHAPGPRVYSSTPGIGTTGLGQLPSAALSAGPTLPTVPEPNSIVLFPPPTNNPADSSMAVDPAPAQQQQQQQQQAWGQGAATQQQSGVQEAPQQPHQYAASWSGPEQGPTFTMGQSGGLQGTGVAARTGVGGGGTVGTHRFGSVGSSGSSGQVGAQRRIGGSRYRYSSTAVGMGGALQAPEAVQPAQAPAPAWGAPPAAAGSSDGAGSSGAPAMVRPGYRRTLSRNPSKEAMTANRRRAEDWMREIAIMKKLSHPNIVRLVEVIDDPASDALLLVMEYVEGMSLHPRRIDSSHWEAVPEAEAWRRTRDVLQGLDYLHFHGVVHGDLKPANLMLDTNTRQVKIVDFGSAVISHAGGGRPGSFAQPLGAGAMSCTPAFRSPESLHAGYQPNFELDIWALGVTVFMWVFGQLPYNGAAPFLIYESIKRKDLTIPSDVYISSELRDFLLKVLNKDPSKRVDVVAALSHPWVTGNCTAPLPIIPREASPALTPVTASPSTTRGDDVSMGSVDEQGSQQGPQQGALQGPQQGAQQRCSNGVGGGGGGDVHGALVGPLSGMVVSPSGELQAASPDRLTSGSGGKSKRLRGGGGRYTRSVSQEEIELAVSRSVGGMAITELMGMVFEEVKLQPRQQIAQAGDPVDTIYLITQGEVEIYQELPPEEAAAVALLLGSSSHRSRILGTVLGPSHRALRQAKPTSAAANAPTSADRILVTDGGHLAATMLPPTSATAAAQPRNSFEMDVDLPAPALPHAPTHPGAQHGQQGPAAEAPSSLTMSAAAASLAQPIIGGLVASRAKALFMGPHIQGLTKRQHLEGGGRVGLTGRGFNPRSPGMEDDDDDDDGDDGGDLFLDSLAGPLLQGPQSLGLPDSSLLMTSSSSDRTGSTDKTASSGNPMTGGAAGAQRQRMVLYPGAMGSKGPAEGVVSSSGASRVLILAVLGPGDTLGFATLDRAAAGGGGSQTVSGKEEDARGQGQAGDQGTAAMQTTAACGPLVSGRPSRESNEGPSVMVTSDNDAGVSGMGSSYAPAQQGGRWRGFQSGDAVPAPGAPGVIVRRHTAPHRFASQQSVSHGGAGGAGTAQQALAAAAAPEPAGPAFVMASEEPPPGALAEPLQQAGHVQQQRVSSASGLPTWQANVRARTAVVAFKANLLQIDRLAKAHPELEAFMKNIAVQQETDLLVSEALRQLRLVSATVPHQHHNQQPAMQQQQQPAQQPQQPLGSPQAALLPMAGAGAAGSGSSGSGGVLGPNAPQSHSPSVQTVK